MTVSALKKIFGYKKWAGEEILAAVGEIADQVENQHNCLRILNHIYVVDRIFYAHLNGEKHGYETTNTAHTPTVGELKTLFCHSDEQYLTFVEGLRDATLTHQIAFQFTDGDEGLMSREEMLIHVSLHGAYHRGAVGEILKKAGADVPRDLFSRYLKV
jgi:uncharacterized damage-inducible protein DinB